MHEIATGLFAFLFGCTLAKYFNSNSIQQRFGLSEILTLGTDLMSYLLTYLLAYLFTLASVCQFIYVRILAQSSLKRVSESVLKTKTAIFFVRARLLGYEF